MDAHVRVEFHWSELAGVLFLDASSDQVRIHPSAPPAGALATSPEER